MLPKAILGNIIYRLKDYLSLPTCLACFAVVCIGQIQESFLKVKSNPGLAIITYQHVFFPELGTIWFS